MVSLFTKPVGVNAAEPAPPVRAAAPYTLFAVLAVIVNAAAPTIISPATYEIV